MNRIEELEKQVKTILEEIEKLKKEEKVESKVWKPEDYEEYYFLNGENEIESDSWSGHVIDRSRYKIGNCFKTKEEAEEEAEKVEIYTQLKRLAEERNTEPIDWNNGGQMKFRISYDWDDGVLFQEDNHFIQIQGAIYCTNRDYLKIAIERIGEENLLKLFKEE